MEQSDFKVIKIIDEHSIVINGGYEQGVSKGQEFEIYIIGKMVKDLDGKELGTLDMIKAYIKAVHVFENMSVCKNAEMQPASSIALMLSASQSLMKQIHSRLPVNVEDISGGWPAGVNKEICVGDSVRLSHG
ncbi:hypothetical protein [Selenomonas dianae]|uniref:Uncharacterized protein n=1 Tax=Selenomonas dianae TaxID=135079 RepID=A0ABN0T8H5_9FIRM|nr:hypothetical protein [Selenomonas dianae]WLD81454.1 hypothetical protein QU667_06280 [Selenomonas dianae]